MSQALTTTSNQAESLYLGHQGTHCCRLNWIRNALSFPRSSPAYLHCAAIIGTAGFCSSLRSEWLEERGQHRRGAFWSAAKLATGEQQGLSVIKPLAQSTDSDKVDLARNHYRSARHHFGTNIVSLFYTMSPLFNNSYSPVLDHRNYGIF